MRTLYMEGTLVPRLVLVGMLLICINITGAIDSHKPVRKVNGHKITGRHLHPWTGYSIETQTQKSLCGFMGPKCRKIKTGISGAEMSMQLSNSLSPLPSTTVPSTSLSQNEVSLSYRMSNASVPDLNKLAQVMKSRRKKCKLIGYKGLQCQKLKWYWWLVNKFDQDSTKLNSWFELVRNEELSDNISSSSELMPENWPEHLLYKILRKWGDPVDQFVFHKYKQFAKSRELKLQVPHVLEIKVSPRTHAIAETGRSTSRLFWDPGFNLKLKLPFFKDELKVAISTGPSFLAGIGTGIVLLIIKSLFAPMIFGMKYMMYNLFFKDSGNPWDMMKMLGYGGGGPNPEPWESAAPPAAIEAYEPPPVHNHYDNAKESPYLGGHGQGSSGYGYGHGGHNYDQKLQFSQLNPILQGLTGSSNLYKSSLEEGRMRQHYKSLLTAPPDDSSGGGSYGITGGGGMVAESQDNQNLKSPENGYNYIPSTGLQAEVENYDPFYSPLLSRIDSIFTHLGYHDEGCRERAVCSIYKFPVKYAPYSNLLSAQLSKNQSELKRPVTSSHKVLRYFKYMKAAKDGQGAANCMEMYPKCSSDTDSVSNLPMITTFNQLSDLMGAEESGPGPTAG